LLIQSLLKFNSAAVFAGPIFHALASQSDLSGSDSTELTKLAGRRVARVIFDFNDEFEAAFIALHIAGIIFMITRWFMVMFASWAFNHDKSPPSDPDHKASPTSPQKEHRLQSQ
jgi:hypothetical protein